MDERDRLRDKVARSRTVKTFGRALNFFGSGAKAVFAQPMKVAAAKRRKEPTQRNSRQEPMMAASIQTTSPATRPTHPFQQLGDDLVERCQHAQQQISSTLQDSREFLKNSLPKTTNSSSGFLSANCFPSRIVPRAKENSLSTESAQDLISTGSRTLLRIKLYDFALYLDRKDVKQSRLGKSLAQQSKRQLGQEETELPLAHGIRDSQDIDMALLVRASRNLPIALLTKEYERILKRRMRVVGGSPNDPALRTMLDTFRDSSLPEDIKEGASVRKGVCLAFTRDQEGNVHAQANNHKLITVKSKKLAQAVFDIYLGDQVVCPNARRDSANAFLKMLDSSEYEPPTADLVCQNQACKIGRLY